MDRVTVLVNEYSLRIISETAWIVLSVFILCTLETVTLALCLLKGSCCITHYVMNGVSNVESKTKTFRSKWEKSLTRRYKHNMSWTEFIMLTTWLTFWIARSVNCSLCVTWRFVDTIEPTWGSFPWKCGYHFRDSIICYHRMIPPR